MLKKKFSLIICMVIMVISMVLPSNVFADDKNHDLKSNSIKIGIYKDDGPIYESLSVPIEKGDTAYTVIKRLLGNKVDAIGSASTLYVQGIDGLYEFDKGQQSGWNYAVNRWMPNYSAGIYELKPGDELIWHYTLNLGRDIQKSYDRFDKYKENNTVTPDPEENEKPVINAQDIEIKLGESFDAKKYATATDKEDGDLTEKIVVKSNNVDISKEGVYSVEYQVKDSNGNLTKKSIKVTVKKANNTLTDIDGHWANKQIQEYIDKGYIKGYEDNTFRPDQSITRAEFVTITNKVYGFNEKGNENFNDVNESDWFYDEICKAVKAGYINGKSKEIFAPNDNITREEVSVILTTINKNKDINIDKLNNYADGNQTSDWAKTSVEGAIEAGYMSGYYDNTIRPQAEITRAESVSMLSRTK